MENQVSTPPAGSPEGCTSAEPTPRQPKRNTKLPECLCIHCKLDSYAKMVRFWPCPLQYGSYLPFPAPISLLSHALTAHLNFAKAIWHSFTVNASAAHSSTKAAHPNAQGPAPGLHATVLARFNISSITITYIPLRGGNESTGSVFFASKRSQLPRAVEKPIVAILDSGRRVGTCWRKAGKSEGNERSRQVAASGIRMIRLGLQWGADCRW